MLAERGREGKGREGKEGKAWEGQGREENGRGYQITAVWICRWRAVGRVGPVLMGAVHCM